MFIEVGFKIKKMNAYILFDVSFLPPSLSPPHNTHTHTYTHTKGKKKTERERERTYSEGPSTMEPSSGSPTCRTDPDPHNVDLTITSARSLL